MIGWLRKFLGLRRRWRKLRSGAIGGQIGQNLAGAHETPPSTQFWRGMIAFHANGEAEFWVEGTDDPPTFDDETGASGDTIPPTYNLGTLPTYVTMKGGKYRLS